MQRPQLVALPSKERALADTLPAQLTPLIGREQEVAAACALLRRPEVRLLTPTGTGGIGKTRLALQIATDLLEDYSDSICFVSLAPISDPDLVVSTIAGVLGIKESGAQPLLDLLKAYLRDKHLLLVLDNFEQILLAAPQLTDLLVSCPHLSILVTSRATLHVQGEHEFPVPPLSLPDLKHLPDLVTLSRYEAVALFIARAQALKPEFQVTSATAPIVAEICTRLDGLPLAIELAAARVKLLSPHALLARLEHPLQVLTGGTQDAPTRQQTLHNTIAWSYHLLNAQEQHFFRRLSVFVGGCTLEAVEALCTTLDGSSERILDAMASLLDKNLLHQAEQEGEEPRFMMLETIREYGLECLATNGETESTQQAHAAYSLRLAEETYKLIFSGQEQRWLNRLERDHANLRMALQWLLQRKEDRQSIEMALRMAFALTELWRVHNHLSEGRTFLEQVLSRSEGMLTALRADLLDQFALLLNNQGDYEQAERRCAQSVALYQELGDTLHLAGPLSKLALIKFAQGECTSAHSLFEECVARYREGTALLDKLGLCFSLIGLGEVCKEQGEYPKACSSMEESLVLARELEEDETIIFSLLRLARVLFVSLDAQTRVATVLEECLTRTTAMFEGWRREALWLAGQIALSQGDLVRARPLLEDFLAYSRSAGYRPDIAEALVDVGRVVAAQGDYVAAQAHYEESLALAKELGFNRLIPSSLEGVATVVAAQGDPARAARLWGTAQALRESLGTPLLPVYRANYEQAVAAARAHLGPQAFAATWAEGRAMTSEQALAARGPMMLPRETQPTPPTKVPPTYPDGLTAREVEVLRLLAQGLSDARIAEQLIISPRTVNTHLTAIYGKIQVSSRVAATRYAIEHHLL